MHAIHMEGNVVRNFSFQLYEYAKSLAIFNDVMCVCVCVFIAVYAYF